MYTPEEIFEVIYSFLHNPHSDDTRSQLLACVQSLEPNQRYSYLQQANYVHKIAQVLPLGNGDSCMEKVMFFGLFDHMKCMLDVPTPEQRYQLLTTPSVSGHYPIIQFIRIHGTNTEMLKYVLDLITPELRLQVFKIRTKIQGFTALHRAPPSAIKHIFDYFDDDEILDVMTCENDDNHRPLDCAVFFGQINVVRSFVEALTTHQLSALLDRNGGGSSPLHDITLGYGEAIEVTKLILDPLPPQRQLELLALRDGQGRTPLEVSLQNDGPKIFYENVKAVRSLLKAYQHNAEQRLADVTFADMSEQLR